MDTLKAGAAHFDDIPVYAEHIYYMYICIYMYIHNIYYIYIYCRHTHDVRLRESFSATPGSNGTPGTSPLGRCSMRVATIPKHQTT